MTYNVSSGTFNPTIIDQNLALANKTKSANNNMMFRPH